MNGNEVEVKSRICTKCKVEKEFSFFYKHKKAKFGVGEKCKECTSAEVKAKCLLKRLEREAIKAVVNSQTETHRTCTACKIEKDISCFGKHKKERKGISLTCKDCKRAYENELYRKKMAELGLEVKPCPKRSKEERKIARAKYRREYRANNPNYHKNWRDKNRDRLRQQRKDRLKNDPVYRIAIKLRAQVRLALKRAQKGTRKCDRTINLLGCNFIEFKAHMEKLFLPGMNFDNFMTDIVHLDHIIPVASFDLTKEEEQRKCFHYTNLMPRFATTKTALEYGSNQMGNINKSDKIIGIDFHEVLL